jgi:hypothetical protein
VPPRARARASAPPPSPAPAPARAPPVPLPAPLAPPRAHGSGGFGPGAFNPGGPPHCAVFPGAAPYGPPGDRHPSGHAYSYSYGPPGGGAYPGGGSYYAGFPRSSLGGGRGGGLDDARTAAIAVNKRIASAAGAAEILALVDAHAPAFDAVCVATAVHRLASARGAPGLQAAIVESPAFFRLVALAQAKAPELQLRHVANILWGFARLGYAPARPVLDALCAELRAKALAGVPQNLSNALWALAALQHRPDDGTMAAVAGAVRLAAPAAESQHISNIVYAW